MLKNMAGHDVRDSTSAKAEVPDFEKFIGMDVRGMKIGIPAEYRPDGLNAEIAAVWDRGIEMLKARGADIVDISLPHTKYARQRIISLRRRKRLPIWHVMTVCVTVCAFPASIWTTCI